MRFTMQIYFLSLLFLSDVSLALGSDFTNHLGMQFKTIQPGVFYMGSCPRPTQKTVCPSNEGIDFEATPNELPQHRVTIAQPFQMSVYEITLEQFHPFIVEENKTELLTEKFKSCNEPNKPVVHVSWNDAQDFIKWLNETKPATDIGTYRLPTEAEWEYAARAGTQSIYWWGDDIGENNANCAGCDKRWGGKQTSPVGYFEPNAFGLYDVVGNVSEWVADCWNRNYVSAPIDGSAWTTGGCFESIIRGGSWTDAPWLVRIAERDWNNKDYRDFNIGFRLVRQLDCQKLP